MNNKKYKILLIEPSDIVAKGLCAMLDKSEKYVVTKTISDLTYFHDFESSNYDLIIVNPIVAGFNKRLDIRSIMNLSPNIVLVAMLYEFYDVNIAYQFDTYIGILDSKEAILKKFNSAVASMRPDIESGNVDLSNREREILVSVAQGKTNKEIAEEFKLSIFTIVTHRKNISKKLGINSISGLTVYAIINKLIDINELKS
ncbi:MAG: LuxR C-terminal-related transcriptional regulator [Muribaculaceae bacterium]|nr:LuxR C-terminal-related transcriptional regulator [Muribaculaceae bacterium]